VKKTFEVTLSDERLDRFLKDKIDGVSRVRVQRYIEEGCARVIRSGVIDVVRKVNYRLQPEDRIEFEPPQVKPIQTRFSKEKPPEGLKILLEDKQILVIDKPAGLVTHPAAGHHGDTLSDWLQAIWGAERCKDFPDPERPGIVHRLDKGTTGVLIIAKTASAHAALVSQFEHREVSKTYVAIALGGFSEKQGMIEGPIGRSFQDPRRMAIQAEGRPAETRFRVKEERSGMAWVELFPATGRTHQLRVHLSAYGHPIAGDANYGSRVAAPRPMLHAWKVVFTHPKTGGKVEVVAKVPKDFKDFWKECETRE